MPDAYTHDYNFTFENFYVRGDAEFNEDGKASWSLNTHGGEMNFSDVIAGHIQEILDLVKRMQGYFGNVERIVITPID